MGLGKGDSPDQLGPEGSGQGRRVEDGCSRQEVVVQRREWASPACGTVRSQT